MVDKTKSPLAVWSIAAYILAGLLLLTVIGHFAIPNEVEVEKEVEVPALVLVVDEVEYTIEDIQDLVAIDETETDLAEKFAEELREEVVIELAKEAVEEDYIDDLNFDEDEFDDSEFKLIWIDTSLDEDDGDYEVLVEFRVLEYNEDEELINEYNCYSEMDVRDDDVIKHLYIGFEEL